MSKGDVLCVIDPFGHRTALTAARTGVERRILDGAEVEPDGEEGYADVRVPEGILEAVRTGGPVKLEPFARAKRIDPAAQLRTLAAKKPPEVLGASNPSRDMEVAPKNWSGPARSSDVDSSRHGRVPPEAEAGTWAARKHVVVACRTSSGVVGMARPPKAGRQRRLLPPR